MHRSKKYGKFTLPLLIGILALFTGKAFAQNGCTVTATANPTTVPCNGGTVDLVADGDHGYTTPLNNDFNNGTVGSGWTVSAAGQFDNPCGPGPDGTTHMWMGDATAAPRMMESVGMNVACGGQICFDMKYSTQGLQGGASCEGPDLSGEGVFLEYSIDGGATWVGINYWDPNGGNDPQLTSWNNYCFAIPGPAETTNTKFRWYQGGSSGTCCDHWGIDNVVVSAQNCYPYFYDWQHVPGFPNDSAQTGVQVNTDTTFTIVYTDTIGDTCTASVSVVTDGLSSISAEVTDETCPSNDDGSITITPLDGNSPYVYDWDHDASLTGNTASGLAAGSYVVTVTDDGGAGCSVTDTFQVNEPAPVAIDSIVSAPPTCYGGCDGSFTVYASGGTTPYEYSVDNGSTFQTSSSLGSLCDGSYDIVVRDSNNCTASVVDSIVEPDSMNFDVNVTDLLCYQDASGEIEVVNATGGDGSYQYSIDGGTSYQASNNFTGLDSNVYNVVVQDGNGCTSQSMDTVDQPSPVVITSLTVDSVNCKGACDGEASVFPGGGTENNQYEFDWATGIGGTYEAQPDNICEGTHDVTIMDDNGCTVDTSFYMPEPTSVGLTASSINSNCGQPDGLAFVDSTWGGTPSYSFQWGPAASNQTTDTATGLVSGTYDVTLIDANGCDTTISVSVGGSPGPDVDLANKNAVSCYGDCDGTAEVGSTGGTSPYTYEWNDPSNQTGATASGLCAGTFVAEVTDDNGCTDTVEISISEPSQLNVTTWNDTTICENGSADLKAYGSGATPNYSYNWTGVGAGQQVTVNPTNGFTSYQVEVTDANGCTQTANMGVTLRPGLSVTAVNDQSICPGDSATFSAIPQGGLAPYSYTWKSATTNATVGTGQTVTVQGTQNEDFYVILEDACESSPVSDTVELTLYPVPQPEFVGDTLDGCAPVTVNFANRTDPSMVGSGCSWEFGQGAYASDCDSATHTFQEPGSYDVSLEVTSPDGCTNETTYQELVHVYPYPVADFTSSPQPTNVKFPEIDFINHTTGASSYEWDFGVKEELGYSEERDPSFTFPSDEEGNYTVCMRAYSQNTCSDTVCREVNIKGQFIIYVPNTFTPDADGLNDEFFPVIQGHEEGSFTFQVFDRWGEQVFESGHPDKKWDGRIKGSSTMAKEDVYIWKVVAKDKITGEKKEFRGHVTLIR